jgi:CheY-like chemotaxis protein
MDKPTFADSRAAGRTGATILVVDDQPDLLENIGLTLESAGHQVLTAGDG